MDISLIQLTKLYFLLAGISPLALHDNARTITSMQGQKLASAGKTVTIVSPDLSKIKAESYQQRSDPSSSNPFASRGFRRYNSDIESISSKSSSQSTRSLDKDATSSHKTSTSSSGSSSRKSSDNSIGDKRTTSPTTWNVKSYEDEYKWDFPGDEESSSSSNVGKSAVSKNDDILEALVKESNEVTRRLSEQSIASIRKSEEPSGTAADLPSTSATALTSTDGVKLRKKSTARDDDIDDDRRATASKRPSIVSIEPWSESQSRRTSATDRLRPSRSLVEVKVEEPKRDHKDTDVRIDVPEDK